MCSNLLHYKLFLFFFLGILVLDLSYCDHSIAYSFLILILIYFVSSLIQYLPSTSLILTRIHLCHVAPNATRPTDRARQRPQGQELPVHQRPFGDHPEHRESGNRRHLHGTLVPGERGQVLAEWILHRVRRSIGEDPYLGYGQQGAHLEE